MLPYSIKGFGEVQTICNCSHFGLETIRVVCFKGCSSVLLYILIGSSYNILLSSMIQLILRSRKCSGSFQKGDNRDVGIQFPLRFTFDPGLGIFTSSALF